MRQDLMQMEQRWGLAVQSAAFGIWDLDVRQQMVHYPPQWKALLGYDDTDEPDSTATWRARVHPEDLEPMLAALNAHLAGCTPVYEKEFRLRAADGSYRSVLSRGRVVECNERGEALRAIGTLTDITDRRELDRLRVESDRVMAAARAKTEFLAQMSHELRTPLNAVLGFTQLLTHNLGSHDTETQRQYLQQIEQAGWRLVGMIEAMLSATASSTPDADCSGGMPPAAQDTLPR